MSDELKVRIWPNGKPPCQDTTILVENGQIYFPEFGFSLDGSMLRYLSDLVSSLNLGRTAK